MEFVSPLKSSRIQFRKGKSRGNLARTPDVAVVISLKLVYTPVDDNVPAPHKSQVTSQKPCDYFETLCLCHMSSARSTSDGRGPVTRKGFRIGRSQGNLARLPDARLHCKLPPHPPTCFITPCMYYMHRRSERRGDCSVLGIRTR